MAPGRARNVGFNIIRNAGEYVRKKSVPLEMNYSKRRPHLRPLGAAANRRFWASSNGLVETSGLVW